MLDGREPQLHPGLRGLLLDIDGTLIDRQAALRAWLRRRAGLGPQLDELLELDAMDHGSLATLARVLLDLRPGLARDPGALAARMRSELPGYLRPDPLVGRALTRLRRAGLRVAVVANGSGASQRAKLSAAKLSPSDFAAVLISGELGVAKPDPAIFEAAVGELGLGRDQVLAVGDSPLRDIAGARAAGIAAGWISRGRRYPSDQPRPQLIAAHLHELVAALLN